MTLAEFDLRSRPTSREKVEIRVRGRVQGVGFRPFVWLSRPSLGFRAKSSTIPRVC